MEHFHIHSLRIAGFCSHWECCTKSFLCFLPQVSVMASMMGMGKVGMLCASLAILTAFSQHCQLVATQNSSSPQNVDNHLVYFSEILQKVMAMLQSMRVVRPQRPSDPPSHSSLANVNESFMSFLLNTSRVCSKDLGSWPSKLEMHNTREINAHWLQHAILNFPEEAVLHGAK